MRLFEIVQPRLYLCNNVAYEEGSIQSASGAPRLSSELNAWLEERRPAHATALTKCFYLATEPITEVKFAYIVSPCAGFERNHRGWLKLLQHRQMPPGILERYARCYWSGEECFDEPKPGWEYRAAKVRILECVHGDDERLKTVEITRDRQAQQPLSPLLAPGSRTSSRREF